MSDFSASVATWSTTAGSNQPANSLSLTNLAANQRAFQVAVRYESSPDTIASATTTDLSTKTAHYITVTGTTTITGLGTVSAGMMKVLIFAGALTFTHNATSLILPGAANITTAAGDAAFMLSLGSGNWRCLNYSRASGLTAAAAFTFGDGSASAPSIAFTSDTNTGFYRVGADQIGVAANGANVATLGSSSVTIPTLSCTTGTVTTLSSTTATASTSLTTPLVISASTLTLRADQIVNFDPTGGTIVKWQADGNQIAYIDANKTAFSSPGATGGANPYQLGMGAHPSDSARNGVFVMGTALSLDKNLLVWNDDGSAGVQIYAEAGGNAIYIYKAGPNPIWRVDNAGATFADGAYSSGGADYAEWFEFVGPRPEPGDSLALDGTRVRIAAPGDEAIGVVSQAPCAIGDANGTDPERRVPVGLVGKLRVKPGAVVGERWRLLEDSPQPLYLVR